MRLGLAILVAVFVGGCAETDSPGEIFEDTSGVEREIHGFSLAESQDGKMVWELKSDYAWRIPEDAQVRLKGVKLVFFDSNGAVNSRLTALSGHVDEELGEMTAKQRVKVVSEAGDTLTTEELTYAKETERITGPGFVRLAKPDRVMTGFEFEANPDLTDYEVRRDVSITIVDRSENKTDAP